MPHDKITKNLSKRNKLKLFYLLYTVSNMQTYMKLVVVFVHSFIVCSYKGLFGDCHYAVITVVRALDACLRTPKANFIFPCVKGIDRSVAWGYAGIMDK